MTLVRTCAVLLALAAATAAPAAAQNTPDPTVVAALTRATVVGAAGGWTAWSAYREGAYVLVTESPDGQQAIAPVASRTVPFDLDLGKDAAGRVVAAYSRCTREPTLVGGANATAPNYTSGRGCRIAIYDLAARTERRLARSRGSASDVLPSVGGRRIAFVAVPTAHALRGKAQLRWRTAGSTRTKVLDTGVRRTGPPSVSSGPAGVDTDGTRVAAIWRYADDKFNDFNSVLRVGSFSRPPRQVAFGVNGDACDYDQVLAPTLSGRTVAYLETNGAEWVLERTPVTKRDPVFGPNVTGEPGLVVTSAAIDGARLVVAETSSAGVGRAAGATRVRLLPIASFGRSSPIVFCDAG